LLRPETIFVHDILRVEIHRHATREVLDPLRGPTAFDGAVVAVGFGIGFFDQRQPGFVAFAVAKVQRLAAFLEEKFEFLVFIENARGSVLGPLATYDGEFVVVADAEVEFVVDDFGDPFAVCS
jgi:hypothetical protein